MQAPFYLSENEHVLEGRVQVVPGEGREVCVDDRQDMTLDLLCCEHGTVVFQSQGQHIASW